MEPRLGYDFSRVRVHTDAKAAESAQAVNAKAYTVGSHLVFGSAHHAPHTISGKRLLAHELVHVTQQHEGLRRCPNVASEQQFDRRATAARGHAAYRALAQEARTIADDIMTTARGLDNCLYYIDKLELLLNTPDAPPADMTAINRRAIREAVTTEQARLATAAGQRLVGVEELRSGQAGRQWTQRRGRDNKIFYVDNTDPNNIVVRARAPTTARGGNGNGCN